jgi:transposase-like protein
VQDGRVGGEQIIRIGARSDTRLRRSVQEKQEIVEATLVPGTSVARVALAYGVNTNMVFYWRKLYREGRLVERKKRTSPSPRLLPVRISDVTAGEVSHPRSVVAAKPAASLPTIRLEVAGKGQLTIAECDEQALRTVLECWLG